MAKSEDGYEWIPQNQKKKPNTDVKIFLIIYISVVSLYLKYHFKNESIFYLDYLQM